MKKDLATLFHSIIMAPFFLTGFVLGQMFWSVYAGVLRARDLQMWLCMPSTHVWKQPTSNGVGE